MALSKLSSRKLAGRNKGARIGSTAGFACGSGSLGPTWGWVSPEGQEVVVIYFSVPFACWIELSDNSIS